MKAPGSALCTPLSRAFPGLHAIPRLPLITPTTPCEPLARLGRAWGVPSLWVKRDDQAGPLYGGNKVRKLEYLLGEARAANSERVVTMGAWGSHHSLATTLYGRAQGFEVEAALFPQPPTSHVRANLAANLAAGLRPIPIRSPFLGPPWLLARRFRRNTHVIAGGGSSPRGIVGYVNAAFELSEQIRAGEMPMPGSIIVPLGTGGTVAGLELGLRLAGLQTRVIAVRVIDSMVGNRRSVARLANRCLAELRRYDPRVPHVRIERRQVSIDHGQFGRGYGHPTPAATDAAHLAADLEGLRLETTYSAKACAAIAYRARHGALPPGPVLFWNTFSSTEPPGYDPSGSNVRDILPAALEKAYAP